MKVLAVSDQIAENLYTPSVAGRLGKIDAILGCGDLPYYYLEYLMTMLNAPLLYVHGNHDPLAEYCGRDGASQKAGPDGGENVHLRSTTVGGTLVAGLEGCIHYRPSDAYQYTQNEMWLMTASLAALLAPNRLLHGRFLDVLVTHSPPFGIHDGHDNAHVGFKSFLTFMRVCRPRYLLHGHVHRVHDVAPSVTQFGATTVINVYPYRILEV